MPIFFVPIDKPDLGNGPLKGVKFVRFVCAEQQGFYALSRMLKRGTNAQFRAWNCSPRGSKFTPTPWACSLRGCNFEVALSMAVDMARAALAVSTATLRACSQRGCKFTPMERACSQHGCENLKNVNHVITIVKTDFSRIFHAESILSPWV